MIDFNSTFDRESFDGIVNVYFCTEEGDIVKYYKMSELEKYVEDNKLNDIESDEDDTLYYNKHTLNHTVIHKELKFTPISEYIDNNWFEVTEQFYLSNNPTEHKAQNTPQKTLRQVG